MGIITPWVKFGIFFLFLLGAESFATTEAFRIPVDGISGEITSWDFKTGEQNWNSVRGWNIRANGTRGIRSNDRSRFFLVDSDAGNGNSKRLVSPSFSTVRYSSVELSFWHYYQDSYRSDDTGYLEFKVGNDQWKVLKRYTSTQGGRTGFKKEVVTLPQEVTEAEDVRIRFRYEARNYYSPWVDNVYWAVDNVEISGTPKFDCEPLTVRVKANFCGEDAQGKRVLELSSLNPYSSYSWTLHGKEVGTGRTLEADIAGTYSLTVTDANGCTGTGTITTSEELVVNGDFEQGYNNTFNTNYDNAFSTKDLGPEGTFAVDKDASDYHPNFYGPGDHTDGNGNFLMVNGHPNPGKVIWEQTIEVQPNINYYFSAWGMNLHSANPARLQFTVNGEPAGTVADLDGVPVGSWIRFHSPEFWNSGSETTAVIQIINLNTTANGNDFGIDDISFGNLDPLPFSVDPPPEITICAGQDLQLYANLKGGREPINFTWTNKRGEIISTEENPVIQNVRPEHEGTYTLRVTDFYGCLLESQIGTTTVSVDPQCNSLDFDGKDDYVIMGDHYDPENSFSIEAWIKPHSLNGTRTILSKNKADNLNEGGFDLSLEDDGHVVFRMNGHKIAYRQNKINTDRWYHLAGVYDGTQAILYIDGIQVASGTMPGPGPTPAPFLIGAMHNNSTPWAPDHFFHGWIEEVRIWNGSISEEQIRFLMNQRLREGANIGVQIPMPAPGLSYADLAGYYRLIATDILPGGYAEDLASDATYGRLRNMETLQQNTAPLPYTTSENGQWTDQNATWTHADVWDIPNAEGITGDPIEWNIVRTSHNITSQDKNITVLGLISKTGELAMADPRKAQNEYNPGHSLRITHYLDLDGRIDLVGESQLLQDEESVLEEQSLGYLERDQQGTASSYNYNYWVSPVSNARSANNAAYRIRDVLMDGTDVSKPGPLVFNHQYHFADGTYSGAKRISTYWLNKYTNSKTGSYSQWYNVGDKGLMKPGEGFSMKGTSGSAAIEEDQNYTFRGKPNNGTIKLEITKGNDYLIGNPYPSAIDGYQFILDNLSSENSGEYEGTNQGNVFNGSLYFWDHFSGKTHYLREYVGGYAILNLSGGTEAVASDKRINDTGERADPSKRPRRFIPVGQAFYVSTKLDPRLEEITSVSGGEITFRNSQRVFETDDQQDDQSEFKSRETGKISKAQEDSREKIYLRFQSPTGYQRQLLVTADPAASDHFDLGYDAPLIENIPEDMYWYFDEVEFVIQGVKKLGRDQELPLGIKIKEDAEFRISVDHIENVDGGMDIFLKDRLNDSHHDLRTGPYVTTAAPGILNDRFTIVFRDPAAIDQEEEKDNEQSIPGELQAFYVQDSKELVLNNPELLNLEQLRISNILGQQVQVYSRLPRQRTILLPVKQFSPGVYILTLRSEEGILTKKIILN